MIKVKICGMKHPANIAQVAALLPDYMGFIFYERSPRYVGKYAPNPIPGCKRVAVFVNEEMERVTEVMLGQGFEAVQLHGEESIGYCENLQEFRSQNGLSFEIIKAFGVSQGFKFKEVSGYGSSCDYFLFDTKSKHFGGLGKRFDWRVLMGYDNERPFFISGGIGPEEIDEVFQLKSEGMNIYAVDINSRVEIKPGLKDIALVKQAIFLTRMSGQ